MSDILLTPKQESRLNRIKECASFEEAFKLIYEWIKKGTVDLAESTNLVHEAGNMRHEGHETN